MKKIKQKYKNVIKKIFDTFYGPIKDSVKKSKDIKIYKIKIEKKNYNIFEVKNCRIYTDTIHDTAFIWKNRIVEGPSFQLRNYINSSIKENIVFKKNTTRFLKKFNGNILSLLTGGGGNNNYFHWMFDVLPRIKIAQIKINLNNINFFLVPNIDFDFQKTTLKLLGIYNKSISSKKYRHILSDKAIGTSHPWQITKSAKFDIEHLPKWISYWIRSKFIKLKSKKKFYPYIYIDRSDSKSNLSDKRKIINEIEIKNYLKKKRFKILKLSEYSFIDQISIFNSAKIIIGNHGAGFVNIIFCKKNTKIIEFISRYTPKMYRKISKDLKLNYSSIKGSILGKDYKNQHSNIKVPINILKKKLIKSFN